MGFRHAHKGFCRQFQHKRKCKHTTGIIWLDLYHFVIASSTNFSIANGKRFFLCARLCRFLHSNFPLRAYYYFILSYLFLDVVVVVCVFQKRFQCLYSFNFAFHSLYRPQSKQHKQHSMVIKVALKVKPDFLKIDKREENLSAHTLTHGPYLIRSRECNSSLENTHNRLCVRMWACECVMAMVDLYFSTIMANAFILSHKKKWKCAHLPSSMCLKMNSLLLFFFFFVIRIFQSLKMISFSVFCSPSFVGVFSVILPFLF